MPEVAKVKPKPSKPPKKQKTGYISWWLFRKKGTVAEDWPTAEELRNDPDVQNEIKMVREAFAHTNKEQNKTE